MAGDEGVVAADAAAAPTEEDVKGDTERRSEANVRR